MGATCREQHADRDSRRLRACTRNTYRPEGVARVLARHPELSVVIAHMGMPEIAEFKDLAEGYPNVMLDTTMAFVDFWREPLDPAIVRRLPELQDRVLFGADFPNIPYEYAHRVEALQRPNLGDDWMRDVLWNNGARLFRTGRDDVA